jgi:DNA polymerase III alpha subunit
MYSISEVAKLSNITARALRHYEEKKLITSSRRSQNGYRYYNADVLTRISEIKKFKGMEFSLDEIRSFIDFDGDQLKNVLTHKCENKLTSIDNEINRLLLSKNEVQDQLLATNQFFQGKVLAKDQRRVLMETIKGEILEELKLKKEVTYKDLEYLKREDYLIDSTEKRDFIEAVKECIEFAKKENIKLGPARGSAPALLSLYAIGWTDFDPSEHNLIPERFSATSFDLHIDVEFRNGQKFVNFCKGVSSKLDVGKIEAFKLPILDIIDNVHKRLDKVINYDLIDDSDPMILDLFRNGDIDKIFSFDIPVNTLLAKHIDSHYYKNGTATKMRSEYLKSQPINDFKDLLNIEAVHRPENLDTKPFMQEYMDRYPKAKKDGHYYNCLTASINEYLKPNYGVIIYQEDIIHIVSEYTSWDYKKCNEFRRAISLDTITENQKQDFLEYASKDVLCLLIKESPVVFCKAHSIGAWPKLIKQTSILKALHKNIYFEEIGKWESENDYSWGDFGFISGGVSLLQS